MYINMYRLRFKAEQHFTVAFSQNQNCTNSILCAILVEHNKFDVHKKYFFKKMLVRIKCLTFAMSGQRAFFVISPFYDIIFD